VSERHGSPHHGPTDREAQPPIFVLGGSLILGGTEGQFVEVVRGLNRSRWNLHLGCVGLEGPNLARLEAAGLHPVSVGCGSFRSPNSALAIMRFARHLRAHRIRLIHSFDFYSNIFGILAARLARVPAVIASQRDLGDLKPPLERRVHRTVLRLARYVVVNSEAVAERLKASRTVSGPRIALIPNGVDTARFAPAPGLRAPRANGITIGTLAKLRPEKTLEEVVRAAAIVRWRWPAARFVIWGEGPCRPELERLVRALGLEHVVELRGATAQPEAALRDLDIFVLCSRTEACPNALLEAMATGLPVVATRVGGIPAVITDGKNGLLVTPGDHSALARAIIRLIEDPALATRVGVQAREDMQREFGLTQMVTRMEAFYDRVLAGAIEEQRRASS
jgi:glycosyltransferase involved in cell wall biosynthesis